MLFPSPSHALAVEGGAERRAGPPASLVFLHVCLCGVQSDCLSCLNVGNKIAVIENLGATLVGE